MRLMIGIVLLVLAGCVKPPALKGVYEGSLVVRSYCGTPEPTTLAAVTWVITPDSITSTGDWTWGPIQMTKKPDAFYLSPTACPEVRLPDGSTRLERVRSGWLDFRSGGVTTDIRTDSVLASESLQETKACARQYAGHIRKAAK